VIWDKDEKKGGEKENWKRDMAPKSKIDMQISTVIIGWLQKFAAMRWWCNCGDGDGDGVEGSR